MPRYLAPVCCRGVPLRTTSAFSLIELLICIAIFAVLVAILVPSLSNVRLNSNLTKDAARLRQMGVAINLYANDNDFKLPGPLYTNMLCYYKESWNNHLSTLIAPYLDAPEPDGEIRLLDIMVSPEYFDARGGIANITPQDATPYHVVQRGAMPSSSGIFPNTWVKSSPFGYPGGSSPRQPYTILQIDWAPLGNIPALTNSNLPNSDLTGFGPVRNTLYLDGHVKRIQKSDPLYENY